jgi:Arc/MetJ-type ribon-helix-helix transcriptional regulator
MPEDRITFTIDPRLTARIQELVPEGTFGNVSDFMHHAIRLTFALERIPVDGRLLEPDPITEFFDSEAGRRVLYEALRKARGADAGQQSTSSRSCCELSKGGRANELFAVHA